MINLKLFLWLKLWFLTVLCSSHISSSASDTFFVNCGSPTNVTVNNRTFESDNNLGREIFDSTRGISVRTTTDSSSGDESTLFETARVFSDASSSYRFPIQKHGWFLIRLYFLPFVSASRDLTTSRFSISAQNFILIRDYKPSKTSVVKEYSLNISSDNLVLEFRPETGSVAFINALEVFRLPENLLPEEAKLIGTQKKLKLMNHAMETVSRVNMGNLSVSRDQDKLWRQWDSDSSYMVEALFGAPVTNLKVVNFSAGGITDDIAPVHVYGTATRLNSENNPNTNANVTWTFKIDPGFDYFLRFHFCNIIVDSFGFKQQIAFDIYVNSEKVESIDMTQVANDTFGAPYFVNAVMRKGRSLEGSLFLSIGGVWDVSYPVTFINGFEILKLSNDKRSLDVSDVVFPNSSSRNKSSNPRIGLIAGLSAALCVAIVFCVVMFSWCIRKRRIRNRHMQIVHSREDEQIKKSETGESLILSSSKIGYRYPLALIKEATDDFDESLVIGVGGYGKVYKGFLRDKTEIAVKRGATQSRQGLAEFKTEIEMLSQFRHRHLVSLIGYCDENNEMIIVYEYMAKGTLKDHLYDSNDNPRLSWKQRLEICVGAARGLHYLHTGSARAIIHRDVKSANILLDENFMAKVADFGLSKTGPDLDQTHVSTAVKGSFGYLDPEYLTRQQLTEKSDVYSFGVVMLEVLCGRPVIDPSLPREKVNLIEWATKLLKKGKMEEIIDPFFDGKVKLEEVKKYCDITEKCLAPDGIERPTMGDLLWNLEFMLEVQAKEEKAAMVDDKIEARVVGSTVQFSVNGMGDIAGVSMSKVFAQMVREETR